MGKMIFPFSQFVSIVFICEFVLGEEYMWIFCEGQRSMSGGISFHLTFWYTAYVYGAYFTGQDQLAGKPQWSSCLPSQH